jgi:hypothetical protein
VHKTAINGSTIPAKVTSITGLIVGSIMLEDVSLASVNLKRAAAAKEVHDTATSPVEDSVSNDGVMRKPIEQTCKKEMHAEGCPNVMAAATEPSGSCSMALENAAPTKKAK